MERFAVHAHDDPAVGHEAVLRLELPHVLELALGHGATVKALGAPRLPVPSFAAAAAKLAQPGTPCTPHLHTMPEKLTSDAANNHLHTCTSTSSYFRNAAGMSLLVCVVCIYIPSFYCSFFYYPYFRNVLRVQALLGTSGTPRECLTCTSTSRYFRNTAGMSYVYKHFSVLQEHRGNVLHVQALLGTSGTPRECLTCTSTSRYFRNTAGMSYMYKHFSVLQEHRGNVLRVQALLGTSGTPRECLTYTSTSRYFRNAAGMSYVYKHFSVLQEHRGNVLHVQALLGTSGTPRECLTYTSTSRYFRNAAGMSYMYKHFSVLQEHRGNVLTCSSPFTCRLYIIYSFLLLPSCFFYSFFSQFVLGSFSLLLVLLFAFWLVHFGGNGGEVRIAVSGKDLITHPPLLLAQWVSAPNFFHTAQKASLSHRGQRGKIDLLGGACTHTPRYVYMYNTHCRRARGRAGSIVLFLADFDRCRQGAVRVNQSKQAVPRP